MEINEFIKASNRLEQYYNKEYTKEQRRIMFDELKDLSIDRYRKLISAVLKKSKFLPKICDFVDCYNEISESEEKDEQEKIECKKCNSTGYIVYTKKIKDGNRIFENQYGAICDCGNAKQYKGWERKDKKHKSEFYIPMLTELGL